MTTSISKAVPRSRLNITYRTHIDGQVVRKELPLRLLIAGDFSGRADALLSLGEHARPLPHLSHRTIYSIGKEGTLESILSRSRISLPIPNHFPNDRRFALIGDATVRVECNRDADRKMTFQLWIKSSRIDQAIELKASATDKVALDSPLYSGELFANKVFTIEEVKDVKANPVLPGVTGDSLSDGLKTWSKKQTDAMAQLTKGNIWTSAVHTDLHGWLEPPVSAAKEPPALFDLVGHDVKVWFQFDTELAASFEGEGRQNAEFRVRVIVTDVTGRSAIRLSDMASLSPERVARAVPQIRRLLVIRWLASQGRSMISANPVLRNHIKSLLKQQKDYDKASAAAIDAQKAVGKALNDSNPANVAAVTSTDVDAVEIKRLVALPATTEPDKAKLAELRQKVLGDEWAVKTALEAWDAKVGAVMDVLDVVKNPSPSPPPTDPDVVEVRRIRGLPTPSADDQAKEAELVKKIRGAAEAAAGARPALTPWTNLRLTVAGLKLENFKVEEDAK